MMPTQLNSWLLFQNAATHFGKVEIVSKQDGGVHRYTYESFARRAQQLMHALDGLGVAPGERVATLAWNHHRHLECYFAVPCTGRVLHTLNVRLSVEDLAYIIEHADDRVIFVDPDQVATLEQLAARARAGRAHRGPRRRGAALDARQPDRLRGADPRAARDVSAPRDRGDRSARALLHVGHDGAAQGRRVHASLDVPALARGDVDGGVRARARRRRVPGGPDVPRQRLGPPSRRGDGRRQARVLRPRPRPPRRSSSSSTASASPSRPASPRSGSASREELTRRGAKLPDLRHIFFGGSQPPTSLIERYRTELGIAIHQAWGMTETSPLASVAWPKESMRDWSEEQLTREVRTQAGLPLPGVRVSIRGPDGAETPRDGKTMGDLLVRGPWVIDGYFKGEGARAVHRGRLVPHGRRRDRVARGLLRDRRSHEGPDQVRRGVDLVGRHGARRSWRCTRWRRPP